jgi:glutathione S-transferase
MQIFGKGTSRSFRCVWAAEEAGLSYEYINVEFGSEGKHGTASKDYRDLNFQGKVPTLVNALSDSESLVLTESGAIINYLASLVPQLGLIPSALDAAARAKYEQLIFFVLSDLEQPLWTNGKHRFAIPKAQRVAEVLPTTLWEFEKSQNALVGMIGEAPKFALGEGFTMADIAIAHTLSWAESFKFELLPGMKAYKDRMYSRQACQRALAKVNEQ